MRIVQRAILSSIDVAKEKEKGRENWDRQENLVVLGKEIWGLIENIKKNFNKNEKDG